MRSFFGGPLGDALQPTAFRYRARVSAVAMTCQFIATTDKASARNGHHPRPDCMLLALQRQPLPASLLNINTPLNILSTDECQGRAGRVGQKVLR